MICIKYKTIDKTQFQLINLFVINFRLMKKSYVRKSRKRKLALPLQTDKNPEDIARQRLFEISDHINASDQAQQINNQYQFLKLDQEKPQKKTLFTNHYVSPKRNDIKLKSIDFRNPLLSEIFKQSLRLISNQIQSKEVFVAKKSAVNVTNYMIMDNRQMYQRTINFRSHSSQKTKIPTNFRKIMRKKSVSTNLFNHSNSLFYSSQFSPKTNSNKLDMTIRTNSVSFQRPYLISRQKQ